MSNINFLGDLALFGALVIETDQSGWPANPSIGTFIIKEQNLYGYLKIGGLETWYPFANKTVSYIHTQAVDSTTWYVNHGLGTTNLWIQVKDTNGNIISVGKNDVDENNFTLTFTSALSGTVMVVAPQTVDVPVVKATEIIVGNGDGVHITTGGVAVTGVNSTITLNGSTVLTSANIQPQIDASIAAVVGAAPAALDTLKEIADQLATDESAVSALTTTVATKAATSYVDSAVSALTTTVGTKAATTYVDSAVSTLNTAISAKAATSYVDAALATKANTSSLATVATSGSYTDLSNKPTLFSGAFSALTGKPTTLSGYGITDAYTKTAIDTALAAKANTSSLATVATSGAYSDLTGTPTIPTVPTLVSAFTNDSGYQTAANVATAIAGKANTSSLSTVATSGSYNDLSNKPTIPTVPTVVSAFTNDSGYQTAANVATAIATVVGAAPAALDTLKEIADQLASDESAVSALTTVVSGKAATTYVDTQLALKANTSSLATVATSGSYTDLSNKPTLFSGSYTDLTSKPTLFSGSFADLTSKPTTLAGYGITDAAPTSASVISALGYTPVNPSSLASVATTGTYASLTGKPTLANVATSGSYSDLSGKPTLATVAASGDYYDLLNKPTLFSGSYNDLTNKPSNASLAGSSTQDFSAKNLTVSGDIMPAVNGVSNIGSATAKFGAIYTKEMHIDANTLYVDGVPVLGSSANTITFTSDVNQGMRIATSGTGNLVMSSAASTTIQTTGQNGDVVIQSSGQGSLTRITSATQVTLTAPTVATVGDSTVSGNLTVTGNFNVKGTVTSIESTVTTVKDNVITLNKGELGSGVTLNVAGIDIDRGDLSRQRLIWNETAGKWQAGATASEVNLATEPYVTTAIAGKANTSSLATVATSGSYADLSNKPTLATVSSTGSYTDLINKPALFSGAYADLSGKPTLATVASSGDYADLTNKPTLFSGSFSALTGKPTTLSGYGITDALLATTAASTYAAKATTLSGYGITDAYTKTAVDTALGLKANTSSLATVATSGLFADLLTKPTTLAGYGITDAITAATAASTYAAKATTLSGYGITNAYTKTEVDTALAAKLTANAAITAGTGTKVTYDANGLVTSSTTLSASDIPSLSWTKITSGTPTTLAGYGITDAITAATAASTYAAKATTLAGYGITDAYTKTAADAATTAAIQAVVGAAPAALDTLKEIADQLATDESAVSALTTVVSGKVTANAAITAGTGTKVTYDAKGLVTSSTTLSASDIPNHDWSKITSGKPTTLSGYGITDAQALDADLTAIAALTGTSGLLKKTAADTWALDTNTYLTAITSSQITTALGYTPFNAANALSGGTF